MKKNSKRNNQGGVCLTEKEAHDLLVGQTEALRELAQTAYGRTQRIRWLHKEKANLQSAVSGQSRKINQIMSSQAPRTSSDSKDSALSSPEAATQHERTSSSIPMQDVSLQDLLALGTEYSPYIAGIAQFVESTEAGREVTLKPFVPKMNPAQGVNITIRGFINKQINGLNPTTRRKVTLKGSFYGLQFENGKLVGFQEGSLDRRDLDRIIQQSSESFIGRDVKSPQAIGVSPDMSAG